MELKANSSNNTIFADADGDIAYFHGNYIPRRDTSFDWTKPVDGSNPATEYKGLLTIDETPHLLNPKSGWLYNSNNWPWSGAGASSPKKEDYPAYVESGAESARGLHAIRVLHGKKDFTLDSLIAAAYDSYLPWFEKPLPALIQAWDAMPVSNPLKAKTEEQIKVLRGWDLRWGVDSVATSLAVFWGTNLGRRNADTPSEQSVQALAAASDKLDGGLWDVENALGRHQSVSAADGRSGATLQRCRAEYSGGFHVGDVGIACVIWGSSVSGYEEMVWNQREQLRSCS